MGRRSERAELQALHRKVWGNEYFERYSCRAIGARRRRRLALAIAMVGIALLGVAMRSTSAHATSATDTSSTTSSSVTTSWTTTIGSSTTSTSSSTSTTSTTFIDIGTPLSITATTRPVSTAGSVVHVEAQAMQRTLPRTGSDTNVLAMVGVLCLAVGAFLARTDVTAR